MFTRKETIRLQSNLEISGVSFNRLHLIRRLDNEPQQQILSRLIETGLAQLFEERAKALGLAEACGYPNVIELKKNATTGGNPEAA